MYRYGKVIGLVTVLFIFIIPSVTCVSTITPQIHSNEHRQIKISSNTVNLTFKPHVVVAVIDLGINVYHEVFRRPNLTQHPSIYIEGFPNDIEEVNLTFSGNYSSNYNTDKQLWENQLKTHTLYWFPHTNIIGISFEQPLLKKFNPAGYPIIDDYIHGTAVSSIIARLNPDATIVMIESMANNLDEAFSWAVNQSWIDIITTEYGMRYRPIVFLNTIIQWAHLPAITKQGYNLGKIIITPSGNEPWINSKLSPLSGPPWVICVGGAEPYCHGASLSATKGTDYVSTFTQDVAFSEGIKEYLPDSGTSFSVPTVAGTISKIILTMRTKLNYTHGIVNNTLIYIPDQDIYITNKEIRNAINHTAIYWKTTQWSLKDWIEQFPYINATEPYTNTTYHRLTLVLFRISLSTLPINPIAPWLQMGWGFVDNSIVNETTQVLLGEKTTPEKPTGAVQYMESLYNKREQIWT